MNEMTIYKYLITCRMNKFTDLLVKSDLSIMEIADHCGLLSIQNVSRIFRQVYSCTPKEYRQRLRKKALPPMEDHPSY